jgi:hypothetical protein
MYFEDVNNDNKRINTAIYENILCKCLNDLEYVKDSVNIDRLQHFIAFIV